jgi:hypothetical protein
MKKILIAILAFLLKGKKARIKKRDVFVLDRENNIYLHRPGKGTIRLYENEDVIFQKSISDVYGDYEAMRVITALAKIVAIAKNCSYERVTELDPKWKYAIRLVKSPFFPSFS